MSGIESASAQSQSRRPCLVGSLVDVYISTEFSTAAACYSWSYMENLRTPRGSSFWTFLQSYLST